MTAFLQCGPFSASDGEGRVLFEGAAVSLEDNQCVTIEGASGSGKSTLLRHLTALAWSPAASRRLAGTDYACAELPAWRARVSLVAQDAPMIQGTVDDNLNLPFCQNAGRDRDLDVSRMITLLNDVGLGNIARDRMVGTLSGGERHRLALVRGLLWDPGVLVADEPLSGLDPEVAEICFDLLLQFGRRPGCLALCVLHDPHLNRRADRRLRLERDGLREI